MHLACAELPRSCTISRHEFRMRHPTVYELLQTLKGDKQVERLVRALDELAGRVESVSGYDVSLQPPAGSRLAGDGTGTSTSSRAARVGRSTAWDLRELELPDPSTGALPLLPGISEFDALQSAATSTASQLHSKAEQHAWRSWVMSPSHFVCVIHAAWLLLALVFKQESPNAKPLQDFVFQQLAQHYVSQVLAGKACVENAALLWTQAIAEAACVLLRSAFPSATELQDPQLQLLLQRQLRLWTTGTLPSDAASSLLLAAHGPESDQDSEALAKRRHTAAPFVGIKPAPLVSSYMASKGLKPVDLLHKQGAKVTNLTVPHEQLQHQSVQQQKQQQPSSQQTLPQQQARQQLTHSTSAKVKHANVQQRQACDAAPSADAVSSTRHRSAPAAAHQRSLAQQHSSGSSTSRQPKGSHTVAARLNGLAAEPNTADASSSSITGYAAKAAECLSAASDAAEQYERCKKAAAAAANKGSKVVKQHIRQLQQKRDEMLFGTRAKVQGASNNISGWLSDSIAPTTTTTPAATDGQCKAQRQLMASHLRSTDWRMEHAFNAAVHDKCLDMAATLAASGPAAADSGLPISDSGAASANVTGGKWAAVAGNGMISRRLNMTKAGGRGAGDTASHDVKVMKAARAIVEDVQRKFAASPTRLPARG